MVADIAVKNGVADVSKSSCTPLKPFWSYRLLRYTALCTTLCHLVFVLGSFKKCGFENKGYKVTSALPSNFYRSAR